MHTILSAATAQHLDVLAADPSLDGVKTLVLKLLGTGLVILLAYRLFKAWATSSYGVIVIEIIAALVISFFVITPDSAMSTLASIRTGIFGG